MQKTCKKDAPRKCNPKNRGPGKCKKNAIKNAKKYACNFWKFVFHKTCTFFCICFLHFPRVFAIFWTFGALTGGPPKNAKNAQFQNSQLFAFFAFVFNFPRVFWVFPIFEDRRPSQKCKSEQFQNLHFCSHFFCMFVCVFFNGIYVCICFAFFLHFYFVVAFFLHFWLHVFCSCFLHFFKFLIS